MFLAQLLVAVVKFPMFASWKEVIFRSRFFFGPSSPEEMARKVSGLLMNNDGFIL